MVDCVAVCDDDDLLMRPEIRLAALVRVTISLFSNATLGSCACEESCFTVHIPRTTFTSTT